MLREKILRYKVMELHQELVRSGQYVAGKQVLLLLRKGSISLGLGDIDWYLEMTLEKIGCRIAYIGRRYTAHIYLKCA